MRNPYEEWERFHINEPESEDDNYNVHINFMRLQFLVDKPKTVGFDTETTGLHIIKDKPFLIQFGWLVPGKDFGRVFTFEPTPEHMKVFFELAEQAKYCVAHNIKYDLSMLSNIGYAEQVQNMTNLVENMVVARLVVEAIPAREGGDSLSLKDLGVKYVHPLATRSEKMVKEGLEKLNKERVKFLTAALKQFQYYDEVTKTGKPQMWNKGLIEKFLKDPTHDLEDLPEDVREVWEEWQKEYPEPTYEDIDRDLMIQYAGEDVITMLEYFKKAYPILLARKQLKVFELENKAILPLYRMERVGIKVDREYLEESRLRVKAYITKLRNEMYELVGEKVTCNQHARIKTLYKEKWGITLVSSDKKAMKDVIKNFDGEPNRLATLINALRTLEKWYSTYIKGLIKNSEYDGRGYTQINQASAVSGRVGSNFQQFPKDSLKDMEGNELYHPRRPFVVTGEGYNKIAYLDYSQVELRCAGHYTIGVSGGDINLCRAYFPFKMSEEEAKNWIPTDLHSETTKNAYPHVPEGTDEFKKLRGKGKSTNFLCLYGGTPPALAATLDVPMDEAKALYEGYNKAFPGLKVYSEAVARQHSRLGYVTNQYGRRYYLQDARDAYKLANYLIQGSCADAMKTAIIMVDEFLKPYKSRLQMTIHDELSYEIYDGEEHLIPKLVQIMEDLFKSWCKVPIVCDAEITETNWREKRDYAK